MIYQKVFKSVLIKEAQALNDAAALHYDHLDEIINLLTELKGKLITLGIGKSGLIAQKMAATFASTGTASFFIHATEAVHGNLGMISPLDAVLMVSHSGKSGELLSLMPFLQEHNITTIALTGNDQSPLAKQCRWHLLATIDQEACPINTAPMSSSTLSQAMGDALAACLMKAKDFNQENFATLHPGGTLGKKLFVRALSLASTENLPTINAQDNLRTAIETMTKGKLGNVLIMQDQTVLAILSDGDLRRALFDQDFNLNNLALNYAKKNPITAQADILAVKALELIEQHKVQILILIDDQGLLKGLVHIHHLVQAGITELY